MLKRLLIVSSIAIVIAIGVSIGQRTPKVASTAITEVANTHVQPVTVQETKPKTFQAEPVLEVIDLSRAFAPAPNKELSAESEIVLASFNQLVSTPKQILDRDGELGFLVGGIFHLLPEQLSIQPRLTK